MIFKSIETTSNHGTEQGILPRFEIQMIDLYRIAMLDYKDYELNKFIRYTKIVVPEITHFYDLYHVLNEKIERYRTGINSGELFKIKDGIPNYDRSIELEIIDLVKDFFIRGRILLINFQKSEIIDDENFCTKAYLLVKDINFTKAKLAQQSNKQDYKYQILINIIESSRKEFLSDFIEIRNGFEHNQMMLDSFNYDFENKQVVEPILRKKSLSHALAFYYENLLDLLEKLMCYYYGIKVSIRTKGGLKLFIQRDYDYKNLKNKYIISPLKFGNLIECDYK